VARLLPGGVMGGLWGGDLQTPPAHGEGIRRTLGLDKPLPVQSLQWVGGMATGNPGLSLRSHEPVGAILARALPITVELVIIAVVFAVALGIPLGVISASRRESVGDYVARVGGLIGLSMPSFWLATLILLFTSIVFQ